MTRAATHLRQTAALGAACAAALAFTTGETCAQHALDANLGVGTGRINAPTPVEDYRARNLIVTGNVAGGRGFRGTVGYGAETDFRGVTGVDDLFAFRAGAALSAPQMLTSPGWQQLRFGQDLGAISLRRGDGGFTSGMVTQPFQPGRHDEFRTQRPFDDRLRLDAFTAGADTTGQLDAVRAGRPIGFTRAEEGRLLAFEASPLRGVTISPLDDPGIRFGLSPYDVARLRAEQAAAPPRDPLAQRDGFRALLDPGRVEPGVTDDRIRERPDEPMTVILDRIARRYADRTDVLVHLDPRLVEQLDEEYRDLRSRLRRLSPAEQWRVDARRVEPDRLPIEPEEEEEWRPDPVRIEPLPGREVATVPDDESPLAPRMPAVADFPPGHLDRLFDALRHGERLERLSTEGNTRFDELMAEGEQALRAGEYFDAERRFMRALRILPGHPLAMIGAAHAQLGAGLQLPAALSIRRVLTVHPELIDVQYGADLLPSRPRLVQVVDATEVRLERTPGDEVDYGLVMAYIGRQIDDRGLIERGLALMQEAAPDDPFVTVLRNVWLAPPAADDARPQGETPNPARSPQTPEK